MFHDHTALGVDDYEAKIASQLLQERMALALG
jgi:hypothetical protein